MVLPGTNPRARRIVPVPRHSLGAPPVTAIISPETQLDTGSASCPACPARNVSGARCGLSALVDAVFVIGLALGLCGTATCAKERPRGRWRRRYGSPLLGYRIFKALPRRLLRCTARRKVDSAPMPAPLGNETAAFRRVRQIRRYPLEGLPFTFDQACSIDGISGVDRMARRHICPCARKCGGHCPPRTVCSFGAKERMSGQDLSSFGTRLPPGCLRFVSGRASGSRL